LVSYANVEGGALPSPASKMRCHAYVFHSLERYAQTGEKYKDKWSCLRILIQT
jgi:hypothetical protein